MVIFYTTVVIAPVGMGPEVVALRLYEVGGQAGRGKTVEEIYGFAEYRNGNRAFHAGGYQSGQ